MLAVFRFFLYNILIRFLQKQSNTLHNDIRLLYCDKKRALELYNGLNHSDYTNEDELEIRTLEDAVNRAINECIEEDVLREFLLRRRAEVMNSILTEYDEEQVLAEVGQEKYEEGRSDGRAEGINTGINALILDNIEDGKSEEAILGKLIKRFSLEYEDAKKYYDVCVKNTRK